MRIPRRGLLALAATVGAITTLLAPTAASAAYYGSETDYGARSSGTPDTDWHFDCDGGSGVFACWLSHGDVFYVKDELVRNKPDGFAAAIDWRDVDGTRSGSCVNKHGSDTWARCNKNFTEGHRIFWRYARYDSGNFFNGGPWHEVIA